MTDQSPTIDQLIESGRERLEKQRAERQAKQAAASARLQSEINEQIAGLHNIVMTLLPEALHAYCGLLCDDSKPLNGWQYARLEVPNCSPITIAVEVSHYHDSRVGGMTTRYEVINRDSYPLYQITRYKLGRDDDDMYSVEEYFGGSSDNYGSQDIEIALASAAEWWSKRATLQAEAQVKNAKAQVKSAMCEAAQSAKEQRATTEREALLDLLGDDPVLLALLKVAIAIKQERSGYAESIEHWHNALETQSEQHARDLDAKQQDALLALRNAAAEVDRAQRESDDLQTQLSRLKRQSQYA